MAATAGTLGLTGAYLAATALALLALVLVLTLLRRDSQEGGDPS
jgi:hypothetical protein